MSQNRLFIYSCEAVVSQIRAALVYFKESNKVGQDKNLWLFFTIAVSHQFPRSFSDRQLICGLK